MNFQELRDEKKWIKYNYVIRVYRKGEKPTLCSAQTLSKFVDENKQKEMILHVFQNQPIKYTYWDRKALRIEFITKYSSDEKGKKIHEK